MYIYIYMHKFICIYMYQYTWHHTMAGSLTWFRGLKKRARKGLCTVPLLQIEARLEYNSVFVSCCKISASYESRHWNSLTDSASCLLQKVSSSVALVSWFIFYATQILGNDYLNEMWIIAHVNARLNSSVEKEKTSQIVSWSTAMIRHVFPIDAFPPKERLS